MRSSALEITLPTLAVGCALAAWAPRVKARDARADAIREVSLATAKRDRAAAVETAPRAGWRGLLPRGNTLPYDVWLTRHRWLVWILAAQAAGLFVFALTRDYSLAHSALESGLALTFAVAAWVLRAQPRIAAVICSIGLITSSAVLVHISGGVTEAHFHFFVVIVLLSLYEDWLPFLVAAAYVAIHHGVFGLTNPDAIYSNPDAIAEPLKWAAVHTFFIAGAGLAAVVAWRLNEDQREQSEEAYRQARDSEHLLLEAHALAGLGGFEVDAQTWEPAFTPELYRIYGVDPSTQGKALADLFMERVLPGDRESLSVAFADAIANDVEFGTQFRYRHPDGDIRHIATRGVLVKGAGGARDRLVGASQDVTERERARELAVQRAEAQRAVAELGERALAGPELHELFADAARTIAGVLGVEVAAVTEWIPDEEHFVVIAEHGLDDSVGHRDPAGAGSQWGYTVFTGEPVVVADWDTETRFGRFELVDRFGLKSGVTAVIRRDGAPFGVLGAFGREPHSFGADDVSFVQAVANVLSAAIERVGSEQEMRHRSLHDPLTALPNRILFVDRLAQALGHAARERKHVAVLYCDLDQFKLVNDSLGHDAGDELLKAIAPRLLELLSPGDTVARFGGDEFAILVAERDSVREITRMAEQVAGKLAAPFVLEGREIFVTASTGIAIGDGSESPETMVRDADLAMYRAKERGRGRYEIFDRLMRTRAVDHLRTENELRRALARDELRVHYQPVISLASEQIVGVEALVRWQHPDRGLIGPGEFIPLAEDSELIVAIGDRVLEIACAQATSWQHQFDGAEPLGISINISARQLADPGFAGRVESVLSMTGLDPGRLSLEVTETMLIDEVENPTEGFARLQQLGLGVVLDDFGTGFSSLSYLKRFPFDLIKIDRAFIDRLGTEPVSAAIVTAVTGIADALDVGVVAEGIETTAQRDAVASLGCRFAQGYLFSRPLPADEITELIAGRRAHPGGPLRAPRSRRGAGKRQIV
jgi:diguanylate cyclase (GGDEF)-like protein